MLRDGGVFFFNVGSGSSCFDEGCGGCVGLRGKSFPGAMLVMMRR